MTNFLVQWGINPWGEDTPIHAQWGLVYVAFAFGIGFMILLVRQINTNFPGMGVFPNGQQAVTCWTCHRGEPHPTAANNKDYGAPKSEPVRQ